MNIHPIHVLELQIEMNDSNPEPCNIGAVLYQLSYQANGELVNIWVFDKPVNDG